MKFIPKKQDETAANDAKSAKETGDE